MLKNFNKDREAARGAEDIVRDTFSSLASGYTFQIVADEREYFYKGDIKATNCATGEELFIEVKNDGVIAKTQNILCEEENYMKDGDYYTPNSYKIDYYIYHCAVCGETIKSEKEL